MTRILSIDVGIKNLGLCQLNYEDNNNDDICEDVKIELLDSLDITQFIDIKKKMNANKIPILLLARGLIKGLTDYSINLTNKIDYIIIENQPFMKNPRMKSAQMIIFSFFVNKFLNNEDTDIRMFLPKNKLNVYTGPPVECKLKSKYSQRKFKSIKYTEYMLLKYNSDFITKFNNSKKKDDLADSYLQGITFLNQLNKKKSKKLKI